MTRQRISSGSVFEQQISYSRAVIDGDDIFVSGTTGFDYATMTISDDLATQTDQCLRNIVQALEQAGASLNDVVRVTYILPKGNQFSDCWPVLNRYFGEIRPAATAIIADLIDPRIRIEIQVTARRQTQPVLAQNQATQSAFKSVGGLSRIINAAGYSMAGLSAAWKHEHAFRQELMLCVLLAIVACVMPVTWPQRLALFASLLVLLIVELLNSSIEAAVDLATLEKHPLAKRSKDVASAAVFMALMLVGLVWGSILLPMLLLK